MISRFAILAARKSATAEYALRSFSNSNKFRPRRRPGNKYNAAGKAATKKPHPKQRSRGKKDPNDVSTPPRPTIDFSNIKVTDVVDEGTEYTAEELIAEFGPLAGGALNMERREMANGKLGIEAELKMMDYFTSAPGSTEDLVAERRILAMETPDEEERLELIEAIERLVEEERLKDMDLPETELITLEDLEKDQETGATSVPQNQLAHGEWGELLIRTDRVCKMWRGGRIDSFRALVVGGNLRGCGGFGIGKSFEPEDAVAIASRMARRNIFFVDRYRNRSLTRDLTGRQNSCKVYLRATDNGLRGNPLCCEILKFMGITNVVAKAHGNRNHYNVVRATYKALQTHESLDDIAMKRGLRLVNLQKAKRLQI